ncbi:transmembrane protein 198-like [Clavelina lepadiformis]|uniref:transmembrane protein 198-like n=1 Tax=Clavelina lepadiformis TaxID=159417 RepID=UPI0040436F22
MPTEVTNLTVSHCSIIAVDHDGRTLAIVITTFIVSLFLTFAGYYFFKRIIFLSGFIFASVVAILILANGAEQELDISSEGVIGITFVASCLCGFVTLIFMPCGLFLYGFQFGTAAGVAAFALLHIFYNLPSAWVSILTTVVIGLCCAVLALKYQTTLLIISTSVVGSGLFLACIDYFVENFLLLKYILEVLKNDLSISLCPYSWIIFGIWLPLSAFGYFIQRYMTAKGCDHRADEYWKLTPLQRVKLIFTKIFFCCKNINTQPPTSTKLIDPEFGEEAEFGLNKPLHASCSTLLSSGDESGL